MCRNLNGEKRLCVFRFLNISSHPRLLLSLISEPLRKDTLEAKLLKILVERVTD